MIFSKTIINLVKYLIKIYINEHFFDFIKKLYENIKLK